MITPIERLNPVSKVEETQEIQAVSATGSMFGTIFQSAIQNVRDMDAKKTEAQYLLATGQLDNPAALTIASTKSQIAVELLVQLRNKSLEAYSELTRINM